MTAGRDEVAVLEANEAFYRAFAAGDLSAMDALWAKVAPITCTHPGWHALAGRAEVMASWASILNSPERPDIACVAPRATVLGEAAIVVCYEAVGGGHLVATNVFVLEKDAWRMVHHQAGPTRGVPGARPGGAAIH